ncbi:PilW family protein [Salicola sp. Rm-C-2C1-2]|uniref:PilW family protein n=1 Tax=Salicola sp. Rm-C-2C1-2 TaxID=3141321 RepID=UPI0032E3BB1D
MIELMIGILLSSLIMLGIVQIFIANNQSFQLQQANARTQEAGRIALEMLTREVRNAGYMGCTPAEADLANNLDESDDEYDENAHALNAKEPIKTRAAAVTDQKSDTDHLWLMAAKSPRDSSGDSIEMRVEDVPNSANFKVNNAEALEEGDIIAITDCVGGDVVQVTNVQGTNGVIVANTGNTQSPGNSYDQPHTNCSGNNCPSRLYNDGAQINQVKSYVFYIKETADGVSSLYRRDLTAGNEEELVRGIQKMKIQYWQAGDWKETPSDVTDWTQVKAARISILVRSPETNVVEDPMNYCFPGEPWTVAGDPKECKPSNQETAADKGVYRVYTATASVRNRLMSGGQ